MNLPRKILSIFLYLFLFNGGKLVYSDGTSTDKKVASTEDRIYGETRSNFASTRHNLNDQNFERYRSSSNFRHKGFRSSNPPNLSQLSQPVSHRINPQSKQKILIPLDINDMNDTFGYYIVFKTNKTIYKTEDPYLFAIVRDRGDTLWKTKRGDYPNKVIYKIVNGEKKLKVYFPEPPPPPPPRRPKVSTLQVVRPVRKPVKRVDRSKPYNKISDPSKVTIEITDPHRPDFKFYRFIEPEKLPPDAPRFFDPLRPEPLDHLDELKLKGPPLKTPLPIDTKPKRSRSFPIPLPMGIKLPKPSDIESEYESEDEGEALKYSSLIDHITLQLQSKQSTKKYCFFEDIRTDTGFYFPRRGYLFKEIKFTRQNHALVHDLFNKWKSRGEFAKMVMINGVDESEPYITIFQTNNSKLFFQIRHINRIHLRIGKIYPQIEVPTEDRSQNVKLYTITNNNNDLEVNNESKYEVSKFLIPSPNKILHKDNLFYHYKFKRSKCDQIKINDKLLWKRHDYKFPQSLYYLKNLNLAIIEFDYCTYNVFKFQSNQWFMIYLD